MGKLWCKTKLQSNKMNKIDIYVINMDISQNHNFELTKLQSNILA